MDLEDFDKLEQSRELVKGLMDIMVFIENIQQNTMIPVTVLCPFKVVLDKIYSLINEIENKEKER